jgi:phytoene dehydrogenase-like protein
MHLGPDLDTIERAYDDAKYGRPSTEPVLELTLPSAVDPSVAPPGKHVMSIFVQYAPYRLAEGSWDDIKEDFADRCMCNCWLVTRRTCPRPSSTVRSSARWTWSARSA